MNPHHCSACGTYWTHPRDRAARVDSSRPSVSADALRAQPTEPSADLERRTVELLRALKEERDANARDHYIGAACCPTCDVVALLAEWEAVRS